MKKLLLYIQLLFILIYNGCGTITNFQKTNGILIPAGIDSITAVESDSISNRLFVSEKKRLNALSFYVKARKNYEIADSLYKIYFSIKSNSSDSIQLKKKKEFAKMISGKIFEAEYHLKKAIKLNPFDLPIKDLLASAYFLHGNYATDPKFYHASIKILNEILATEKGEHIVCYRMGENYYKLENWHKAHLYYKQAEKILLSTAFLNKHSNESTIDSVDQVIHFRYVYLQAITAAKLYNTKLALSLFERAQHLAPSEDQLKLVENYTKWIQWDRGNIAASEKKNIIFEYIRERKFNKAKLEFEKLLKALNTQKAKDEISWRIALLEYEFLDQKEKGCQRLHNIVNHILVDSTTGLTVDPDYQKYIDDCGIMFYKLGLNYEQESKYKDAYQCFVNASKIQWDGRWKSLLELAKLSIQNPQKTLTLVNQIVDGEHYLNNRERIDMLTLKLNALKRYGKNRLDEVRATYRQIRSLQKR